MELEEEIADVFRLHSVIAVLLAYCYDCLRRNCGVGAAGRETLLWQADFTWDELYSKMSKAKNKTIPSETE